MRKQSERKEQAMSEPHQQTAAKPKRPRKASKKKEQNESGLLHISDERLTFLLEGVKRNQGVLAAMEASQLQPGLRSQHERLLHQATQLETTICTEQSNRLATGGLA